MPDLLTLNELRSALGVDPTNTKNDARYTALLPMVSASIRSLTERDFGMPLVTETRTYGYDGSGYLDIDDATSITSVVLSFPNTGVADLPLPITDWIPKPYLRDDSLVYQWLELPGYVGAAYGSPEMGFQRNLDVYAAEHRHFPNPSVVKVTGTFGWPVVPDDVKMAAVWTIQEWIQRPGGEGLTSESIEGWARAWGARGAGAAAMAVPARARDILASYARINV